MSTRPHTGAIVADSVVLIHLRCWLAIIFFPCVALTGRWDISFARRPAFVGVKLQKSSRGNRWTRGTVPKNALLLLYCCVILTDMLLRGTCTPLNNYWGNWLTVRPVCKLEISQCTNTSFRKRKSTKVSRLFLAFSALASMFQLGWKLRNFETRWDSRPGAFILVSRHSLYCTSPTSLLQYAVVSIVLKCLLKHSKTRWASKPVTIILDLR